MLTLAAKLLLLAALLTYAGASEFVAERPIVWLRNLALLGAVFSFEAALAALLAAVAL